VADEIHQYLVPGRHSSVKDALVDALATLATVGLIALLGALFGRRQAAEGATAVDAPRVELLTREGCHLCEEAHRVLACVLGDRGIGFTVVDVDATPPLATQYGHEVPVVLVDGIKRFKGRVDPVRLERLLAERARLRSAGRDLAPDPCEAAIES